jgi:hypothetical protein
MRTAFMLLGILALTACATTRVDTGPTTTATPVQFKMPTIEALDPSQEIQERDGVRIVSVVEPFRVERIVRSDYRAVPALIRMANQSPVDKRDRSIPDIQPEELSFKLRITNRMPRVLRLAGTAVAFQVAGRNVSVPQERYAEFQNAIVLPQQEVELPLYGPSLLELIGPDSNRLEGDTATLALLLFDIVTQTDAAGEPTRRSNFEFYYRFSMPSRSDSVTATVTRLAVTSEVYAHVYSLQGGDLNRWVSSPQLDALYSRHE